MIRLDFAKLLSKSSYKIYVACLALCPICYWSCAGHEHDHEHEGHDHEAELAEHGEAEQHEEHGDEIVMKPEAIKSGGIRWEKISASDFNEAVKTAGVLENSRGGERVISAPASGIVSFGSGVVVGSPVHAGQMLFSISSKGLEQSDATSTAGVEKSIAEKELRRAEELVKEDLISRREYERIKSDYDKAVAIASTVGVKARSGAAAISPIGGYLISVNVSPGAFVNMGDPIATVAANRRLLLRAELSERNLDMISRVKSANIQPAGSDRIISLAPLNPRVLTAGASTSGGHYFPVYIEFDNPGGLGSGSVVETWLIGSTKTNVISVPKSALIEEGGSYYIFVKEDEDEHDAFKKTPVTIGGTDGARVEILSGLQGGETVVTEGAPKVRMAGMGSAIPGHSHHH